MYTLVRARATPPMKYQFAWTIFPQRLFRNISIEDTRSESSPLAVSKRTHLLCSTASGSIHSLRIRCSHIKITFSVLTDNAFRRSFAQKRCFIGNTPGLYATNCGSTIEYGLWRRGSTMLWYERNLKVCHTSSQSQRQEILYTNVRMEGVLLAEEVHRASSSRKSLFLIMDTTSIVS